MQIISNNGSMKVLLTDEIDHHSASLIRQRIDTEFSRLHPERLILDFSQVSFMDSSAVGLVLGRYKKAQAAGADITVSGLKARDRKIMMLSGLQNKVEFR